MSYLGISYRIYFQFRYNFAQKRGEVKIDREYRQRCGVHGGDMVRPLVGEVGGGSYVMAKTMGYARPACWAAAPGPPGLTCRGVEVVFTLLFPRTFLPDRQHFIPGQECNNPRNMDFIHWALLDSSGEPYYVM